MSGVREQEAMYCYCKNIDPGACHSKVSLKPDRNWTLKAYKEREIPIPGELVALLKPRKAANNISSLFSSSAAMALSWHHQDREGLSPAWQSVAKP